MILSNLYGGWCDFKLGDFKGRCSYIKNVPVNVLEGVLDYLKYGRCAISFDEEGTNFYLVTDTYFAETFIVYEGESYKRIVYTDENPDVVMASLYDDIASNVDEWVDWMADSRPHAGYIKKSIENLLEEIDDARRNH